MSKPTQVGTSSFVVVGAGAAGALTVAHLLGRARRTGRRVHVTLVDPGDRSGPGAAYSTNDRRHLLNVRAQHMSAYSDDTDHFLRWLRTTGHGDSDPCRFARRAEYGRYLEAVLCTAISEAPAASVERCPRRAAGIDVSGTRVVVSLDDGGQLRADAVVLALGHLGVSLGWAPDTLRHSPRLVADPWAAGSLAQVAARDVLLVGSGLTAVDCLLSLSGSARRVHMVSRHGLLPTAHRSTPPPVTGPPTLPDQQPTLGEIRSVVNRHIATSRRVHGDWRPAVDSLRPLTAQLWQGLCEADRQEFASRDARRWEAVRHRMPPASAALVRRSIRSGLLVRHTGAITSASEHPDSTVVQLSDGAELRVGAVINCTGPSVAPETCPDPLVRDLLASGRARPGPLGIGFDTDPDGALLAADGSASTRLWTLGSLRRGTLWESTAIPEIRQQAEALAALLTDSLPPAVDQDGPEPPCSHPTTSVEVRASSRSW